AARRAVVLRCVLAAGRARPRAPAALPEGPPWSRRGPRGARPRHRRHQPGAHAHLAPRRPDSNRRSRPGQGARLPLPPRARSTPEPKPRPTWLNIEFNLGGPRRPSAEIPTCRARDPPHPLRTAEGVTGWIGASDLGEDSSHAG